MSLSRSGGLRPVGEWIDRMIGEAAYGLIISRGGITVAEWYGGGLGVDSLFLIGSIRKSFNSALVGHALQRGEIELATRACVPWPELVEISGQPKDEAITLHHLMSSVSGWLTPDPPGKVFLYNNAAFTAAERVVARLLKLPNDEIAPRVETLFKGVLGADSWRVYHWTQPFDPANHRNPGPKLAVDSNLRDLLKWGQLWLDYGHWHGQGVIPEKYVRLATSQVNPTIPRAWYGYNWFVNVGQTLWPSVPADGFGHSGVGTLKPSERRSCAGLWVCPSLDLVAAMIVDLSTLPYPSDFLGAREASTAELVSSIVEAVRAGA